MERKRERERERGRGRNHCKQGRVKDMMDGQPLSMWSLRAAAG